MLSTPDGMHVEEFLSLFTDLKQVVWRIPSTVSFSLRKYRV